MSTTDRRAAVDRLADAKAGDGVLVIGTTPFIGEGFDAPALDTLFLAAPVSYDGLLVQCAGRVIRAAPGKDTAEVHDYHDPATRSSPPRSNAACPATAHSASPRPPGERRPEHRRSSGTVPRSSSHVERWLVYLTEEWSAPAVPPHGVDPADELAGAQHWHAPPRRHAGQVGVFNTINKAPTSAARSSTRLSS